MMRRAMIVVLGLAVLAGAASAGSREFYRGSFTLTPQVGLNQWTIPFGLNAEYGISPNFGIGGTAMFWMWSDEGFSQNIVGLAAEGLYHFTGLRAPNLDLFAGLALGYAVYSYSGYGYLGSGASGLDLGLVFGMRYFFGPRIGLCLRLVGSFIGDWAGFGGQLGVTFRLK